MTRRIPGSLWVLIVFCLLSIWPSWKSYDSALRYERQMAALIQEYGLGKQAERALRCLLSPDACEREREALLLRQNEAMATHDAAYRYFYGFIGVAALGLGLIYFLERQWTVLAVAMLIFSLIALAPGLAAPAMAAKAFTQVLVLGDVVHYFESKGILTTILSLLRPGGSYGIGIPLLFFSVLIPVMKSLVLMVGVLSQGSIGRRSLWLAHKAGKWSMADVSVVGWLLAFMATERQQFMMAELQVGIFFFLTYVVLSVAASWIIEHQHQQSRLPPT